VSGGPEEIDQPSSAAGAHANSGQA
jgi:hypothetical protein